MKRKIIITVLIALMALICMSVAACGHTHKYEDRVVPPTCTEDGYTEHECSCGDSYRDNVVAAHHTLTLVPEVAATCTEEGHSVYYICSACNKWFEDENGHNEITDKSSVILSAQHSLNLVPEKAATCTEEGNNAYYVCSACNKWFEDENGQNEITDKSSVVIGIMSHNTRLVSGQYATCSKEGYCAYYICVVCNKWFEDKDGKNEITDKNRVILAVDENNHSYGEWQIIKAATCIEKGLEKRVCAYNAEHVETRDIDIGAHTLNLVPEKAATCTEEGYCAYYVCSVCNEWFGDESGKVEITDKGSIITKKKAHSYVDGVCIQCGRKQPTEGLEYTKISGKEEYAVSGIGTATATEIVIPEKYNGLPVTSIYYRAFADCVHLSGVTIGNGIESIGYGTFHGCSSLVSVAIGSGITRIEEGVFRGCSSLTDVTIPSSVKSIGDSAFYGCSSLTDVTIPGSVESIGNDAFSGCGITSVTISDSVTSIGKGVFVECDNLTSIVVSGKNSVYHSDRNCLIDSKNKSIISGCKNSVIPDDGSVKSIGDYAFRYCGLTSITIPDSVTSIGKYAFHGCSGLERVVIPGSVKLIGEYAFWRASGLRSVTMGSGVTSIDYGAFYDCSSLTDVTIPSGVKSIDESVFSGCRSLTDVIIPNSVTSIGNSAFYGCGSLTEITIPSSVAFIGNAVFSDCGSLRSIVVSEENSAYHSDGNCLIDTKSKTIIAGCKNSIIPDDGSVTSIANHAFRGCDGLITITIPTGITSIGKYAFYNCDGLTDIMISDGVTSIGDVAFASCDNLSSVMIPDSIMNVGLYAFNECNKLTFSEKGNLRYLGNSGNPYLCLIGTTSKDVTEVTIDDNCKVIANRAFRNCTNLANVTMGSGVKIIGEGAFMSCNKLADITIPNSVTSIGLRAFALCRSLEQVTIGSGAESIGEYTFIGCSGLKKVTIGSGVKTIGERAFVSCFNLTEVIIPDSVTSIGREAFKACHSLKEVTIPDSVTSIGREAFKACHSLKEVTIPDSVTSIGEQAFYDCRSLLSITIPNNVTSIGYMALWYCDSLASVYYKGTAAEWEAVVVEKDNGSLQNATIYYYSETEPQLNNDGSAYDGNYWHYDDGGNIVVWTK